MSVPQRALVALDAHDEGRYSESLFGPSMTRSDDSVRRTRL
jgi:hypothetical protein